MDYTTANIPLAKSEESKNAESEESKKAESAKGKKAKKEQARDGVTRSQVYPPQFQICLIQTIINSENLSKS